jgi:hypothetical protein
LVVVDALVRPEPRRLPFRPFDDPRALPAAAVVHGALVDLDAAVVLHQDAVAAGRPPRRVRRPAPGGGWPSAGGVPRPAPDLCGARRRMGRRTSMGRTGAERKRDLKKKERGVKRGRADADFDKRRRKQTGRVLKWVIKYTARAGAGAAGSGIAGPALRAGGGGELGGEDARSVTLCGWMVRASWEG